MNRLLVPLTFAALLSTASSWAVELPVKRTYLNQVALVFRASDLLSRQLPFRSPLSGGRSVETHQALRACVGVAKSPEELLVFLPTSKTCLAFSDRFTAVFREYLGQYAALGLERDRSRLADTLSSQKVVVMETLAISPRTPQVCVCPPGPGGEQIFLDGFETIQ